MQGPSIGKVLVYLLIQLERDAQQKIIFQTDSVSQRHRAPEKMKYIGPKMGSIMCDVNHKICETQGVTNDHKTGCEKGFDVLNVIFFADSWCDNKGHCFNIDYFQSFSWKDWCAGGDVISTVALSSLPSLNCMYAKAAESVPHYFRILVFSNSSFEALVVIRKFGTI